MIRKLLLSVILVSALVLGASGTTAATTVESETPDALTTTLDREDYELDCWTMWHEGDLYLLCATGETIGAAKV